jgi:hypothetical protein
VAIPYGFYIDADNPGVLKFSGLFLDKALHAYVYNGKPLSGVTGAISRHLGKKFDSEFVEESRGQGSHIHEAIEAYLRTGKEVSVHPAARWVIEQLRGLQAQGHMLYSEVLITDKKRYASAIDILDITPEGNIYLFDTKAGNFIRDYVSWQLGVYKFLLSKMTATSMPISRCFCLSTKDKDIYPIIPRIPEDVKKLLYREG